MDVPPSWGRKVCPKEKRVCALTFRIVYGEFGSSKRTREKRGGRVVGNQVK